MKTLILSLTTIFIILQVAGQKQRLENDSSQFLCKNDSVGFYMMKDLTRQKIDTTIKVLFDYDNGRLETSKRAIFWKKNNQGKVRITVGCDNILKDTTFIVDMTEIFSYIDSAEIIDINIPVQNDNGSSHDTGYLIEIGLPNKMTMFRIRTNALLTNSKKPSAIFDSRIILTKMIKNLID